MVTGDYREIILDSTEGEVDAVHGAPITALRPPISWSDFPKLSALLNTW